MSGIKGRAVLVKRSGVTIAGVRTKSLSIAGSPIDISSDDDAGVRKLMDEPGQVDVNISVSGVLVPGNSAVLSEALSTSDRVAAMQFIFGGFEGSPANTWGFIGDFFMSSLNFSGEYQGAVTFEAEFQSTGPVSYTSA